MLSSIFGFIGLTGADGRLSFSKLVIIAVLALSAATGTFGLGIATLAVASSHGTKVLLALIGRYSTSVSDAITVAIDKAIRRRKPKKVEDEAVG